MSESRALRALEKENDKLRERIKELEVEKAETLNQPHLESIDCPTYHDGCHCTVETLIHNIKRAEKADERVKELKAKLLYIKQKSITLFHAKDLAEQALKGGD